MIFLRKIVPGAADDSYGVEVAKLAGLPDKLIARARAVLKELESGAPKAPAVQKQASDQVSLMDLQADEKPLELLQNILKAMADILTGTEREKAPQTGEAGTRKRD